jgi:DNA-binding PucR family transcriptional regulator
VDLLAAHDAERGTDYIATLRAYLDSFGDIVGAAVAMHVHRNTFRYRLARLAEMVGLDLDDPDERLIAQLQLHALSWLPD